MHERDSSAVEEYIQATQSIKPPCAGTTIRVVRINADGDVQGLTMPVRGRGLDGRPVHWCGNWELIATGRPAGAYGRGSAANVFVPRMYRNLLLVQRVGGTKSLYLWASGLGGALITKSRVG